jgi:hypothetical protein
MNSSGLDEAGKEMLIKKYQPSKKEYMIPDCRRKCKNGLYQYVT